MEDFALRFREVIPDQTLPIKWNEIILDTGCTQSTLQDIKATERAGGFSYKNSHKSATRNRFIYWRISQDLLELVEQSFDLNLKNNYLRYKFTDTPLLDGLSIHETVNCVVILVATVSSVHRLSFPHPATTFREGNHAVPSIFTYATLNAAKDPRSFYIITRPNNTASSPLPNGCTSWLSNDEAVFTLACSTGLMLLIRLSSNGQAQLKQINEANSIMPRLFTNIAEALRGKQEVVTTASMVLHNYNDDTLLYCLGSDATLRTWSTQSNNKNMLSAEPLVNTVERSQVFPGFQPHMMRKCCDNDGQLYLAVYLCFSTEAKFIVLRPVYRESGQVDFTVHAEVMATEHLQNQYDLVDFCLSPDRLWAVWRTIEGATSVTSSQLDAGADWQPAMLEEAPGDPKNLSESAVDPKLAYIEEIFYPGKFPHAVITRALSIYQRSATLLDHAASSPRLLKGLVCQAVEGEIARETRDCCEEDEDERLDIAHQHWAAFYSSCLQYHAADDKPGGVAMLNTGGLLLVKKQRYSILRPMELLEQLTLTEPSDLLSLQLLNHPELGSRAADIALLVSMLGDLHQQLPDEQMQAYDTETNQWRSHDIIAMELARELADDPNDENILDTAFLESLHSRARQMSDFHGAAELLLSFLTPHVSDDSDEMHRTSASLFVSQPGASVVAMALQQIVRQRLLVCRCLLLLESLLQGEINPAQDSASVKLNPCATTLAHAYHAISWACGRAIANTQGTVAQLFMQMAVGGSHMAAVGRCDNPMLPYIDVVIGLLWPLSGSVLFPDFLYTSRQLSVLLGYERLLTTWCDVSLFSRRFLKARTMLALHRAPEACELFIEAIEGVTQEPYILHSMQSDNVSLDRAHAVYYLKIMEMLDRQGYSQEVIQATESALKAIRADEPELPTFHSLLFTHAMGLGRHDEAYGSMMANPDEERRRDCLREMVVTLVRIKKVDTLLEFPYSDMFHDMVRVLESRARAADMNTTAFYDALYSLHLRKGTLRKAAAYMYEQAYRLEHESTVTLATLEKQKGCYLACLNLLRLVAARFRWLVRPKQHFSNFMSEDSEEPESEVKLMEVADIKKELELVNARIQLINTRPEELAQVTGKGWNVSELVGVLTNAQLYCTALHLVKLFNLTAERPLEGLATACVQLQQQPTSDPWDWLANNDLSAVSDGEMNASNTAWKLLEVLLSSHEEPGQTMLHKVIITRLLRESFFPPQFLLASYKQRNPAELAQVYLRAGRLSEAANIAIEYLQAIMGSGSEYFGGSCAMLSGQPTCLPWQTLDQLVEELDRPNYEQSHADLKNLIIRFIQTSTRLSVQS